MHVRLAILVALAACSAGTSSTTQPAIFGGAGYGGSCIPSRPWTPTAGNVKLDDGRVGPIALPGPIVAASPPDSVSAESFAITATLTDADVDPSCADPDPGARPSYGDAGKPFDGLRLSTDPSVEPIATGGYRLHVPGLGAMDYTQVAFGVAGAYIVPPGLPGSGAVLQSIGASGGCPAYQLVDSDGTRMVFGTSGQSGAGAYCLPGANGMPNALLGEIDYDATTAIVTDLLAPRTKIVITRDPRARALYVTAAFRNVGNTGYANINTATLGYDATHGGRLSGITYATPAGLGASYGVEYDPTGAMITGWLAPGADGSSQRTSIAYASGSLASITDPDATITTWLRDGTGRVTATKVGTAANPGYRGTISYAYCGGNTVVTSPGKSNKSVVTLDAQSRPTKIVANGASTSIGYTPAGATWYTLDDDKLGPVYAYNATNGMPSSIGQLSGGPPGTPGSASTTIWQVETFQGQGPVPCDCPPGVCMCPFIVRGDVTGFLPTSEYDSLADERTQTTYEATGFFDTSGRPLSSRPTKVIERAGTSGAVTTVISYGPSTVEGPGTMAFSMTTNGHTDTLTVGAAGEVLHDWRGKEKSLELWTHAVTGDSRFPASDKLVTDGGTVTIAYSADKPDPLFGVPTSAQVSEGTTRYSIAESLGAFGQVASLQIKRPDGTVDRGLARSFTPFGQIRQQITSAAGGTGEQIDAKFDPATNDLASVSQNGAVVQKLDGNAAPPTDTAVCP